MMECLSVPGSAASTFAFRHRSNAASAWPCLNKVVSLLSISSNSPASSTCSKRSFAFSIRLSVSTAKALMMRSATAGVACCILAIVSASMASKLFSTNSASCGPSAANKSSAKACSATPRRL